jgi:hypothetical protein
MSNYFSNRPNRSEQEERYSITQRAKGRCECDSTRHDHHEKCNRRLQSTFRFYNQVGDQSLIHSYDSIAVCGVCARYIREVGY